VVLGRRPTGRPRDYAWFKKLHRGQMGPNPRFSCFSAEIQVSPAAFFTQARRFKKPAPSGL